jgi:hypothetical protein
LPPANQHAEYPLHLEESLQDIICGNAEGEGVMIIIKMPGGDLEYVAPREFLWMREAFDHEWSGTVMLRLSGNRIYSIESLGDLRQKFGDADIALAEFTPPAASLVLIVNAGNVREVEASNPILHHELARAVLKFGPKLSLAVRETLEEARLKLMAEGVRSMEMVSVRRAKRRGSSRKGVAKARSRKRKRNR